MCYVLCIVKEKAWVLRSYVKSYANVAVQQNLFHSSSIDHSNLNPIEIWDLSFLPLSFSFSFSLSLSCKSQPWLLPAKSNPLIFTGHHHHNHNISHFWISRIHVWIVSYNAINLIINVLFFQLHSVSLHVV